MTAYSHPRLPLVGLALSFIAGTGAGLSLPSQPLYLAACCGAMVLLAAISLLRQTSPEEPDDRTSAASFHFSTVLALHAVTFCIGWFNATCSVQSSGTPSLQSLAWPSVGSQVVGIVSDDPVSTTSSRGVSWRFPIEVESFAAAGMAPEPAEGTVYVTWLRFGRNRMPRYGDRWRLDGEMTNIVVKAGPKAGQQRLYMVASPRSAEFLSAGHGNKALAYCMKARASAKRLLSRGIENHTKEVAVLNSLLLGFRSQMPNEIYQAFAATGTLHIFAISGSHVVILAGVIVFALRVFRIQRTRWVLFVGPLLAFYTIMTGLQPSAVRACIMAIIFLLAPFMGRRSDIFSTLSLSAILILVFVPGDLFNIGFILSYTAMIGIVLLYPVCMIPLAGLFKPDPLRLQPEPRILATARAVWAELTILLSTSVAAWLVSTPLTMYYFQMFSPIALLGNLLAIPLASLIIITGSLSLVTGSCIPFLGEIFNHANFALASLLTGSMQLFAAVPGGHFAVPSPAGWLMTAIYLALAYLIMAFRTTR